MPVVSNLPLEPTNHLKTELPFSPGFPWLNVDLCKIYFINNAWIIFICMFYFSSNKQSDEFLASLPSGFLINPHFIKAENYWTIIFMLYSSSIASIYYLIVLFIPSQYLSSCWTSCLFEQWYSKGYLPGCNQAVTSLHVSLDARRQHYFSAWGSFKQEC